MTIGWIKTGGVRQRQREEARKFEALQTVGAPIIKEDNDSIPLLIAHFAVFIAIHDFAATQFLYPLSYFSCTCNTCESEVGTVVNTRTQMSNSELEKHGKESPRCEVPHMAHELLAIVVHLTEAGMYLQTL